MAALAHINRGLCPAHVAAQPLARQGRLCLCYRRMLVPVRSGTQGIEQRLERMEVDMLRLAVGQPLVGAVGQLAGGAAGESTTSASPAASSAVTLEHRMAALEQEFLKLQKERQSLHDADDCSTTAATAPATTTAKHSAVASQEDLVPSAHNWMTVVANALQSLIPWTVAMLACAAAVVRLMQWQASAGSVHISDYIRGLVLMGMFAVGAVVCLGAAVRSLQYLLVNVDDLRSGRRVRFAL